jgi:hypothetical protein
MGEPAMLTMSGRKHVQRHEKPFKCDVPDCTRKVGFTTKNDLERHQKSIHQKIPNSSNDRSFRCMGAKCGAKKKIWPRLDNFKSHCVRVHPQENIHELVRKSARLSHNLRPHTDSL